jgi:cyclopropane fatty-acyl-phospholipid synthase-like methyltransferase
MRITVVLLLAAVGVLPCAAQRPFSRPVSEHAQNLAPFVPSPQTIVNRMLEAANVKPGEIVYDLGCGDGRVLITAAQRFRARAVGVELSETLVKSTLDTVKRMNLEDQIKVIHGNLLNVNLDPADVVVIYLETLSNDIVRPNLEKYLKPGARVVSHDFAVRGWKPARVEKIDSYNRPHTIYVYEMPQGQPKKK